MKRIRVKGKGVWVKWYRPTPLGKWFVLLLTPPLQISQRRIEEILSETFRIYMKSIARLCSKYDIDPGLLKDIFVKHLTIPPSKFA
jgi:hypothetical protein